MRFIAIIEGLGGDEYVLTPQGGLATAREKARKFRSEKAAADAISAKVATYAPVIQRHTSTRVEPVGEKAEA